PWISPHHIGICNTESMHLHFRQAILSTTYNLKTRIQPSSDMVAGRRPGQAPECYELITVLDMFLEPLVIRSSGDDRNGIQSVLVLKIFQVPVGDVGVPDSIQVCITID